MTETEAWNFGRLHDSAAGPGPSDPPALGKYRILREVARGAMGVVYEADDPELKRRVAIKILRDLPGAAETIRKRFQREAESAAKLDHPNVVRVYDSGEDAGRMYLVMEYVDGHPLSVILGQRKHEIRPMLELLVKVARGVAAAHAAGIVHRDLKPANILVTLAGEPKVGDFGLAHWLDSDAALTKSGTPLGTPMYMSPEQVRGDAARISPATDVYALGGILYEILTGRPPHSADSTMDIYARITGSDPTPPRRLSRHVDAELETLCLKALEKEPSRRYADAGKFADDLRRHLDGESVLARPPGPALRAARWARRHRRASVAMAMVLVAAAAVAGTLASKERQRRRDVEGFARGGREALEAYLRLGSRIEDLQERERGLATAAAASIDPELKKPWWALQREIRSLEGEALGKAKEIDERLAAALGLDPDHADARAALAAFHYAEFERAERAGDLQTQELHRRQAERLGDDALRAKISSAGTLSVESFPPGATVELSRFAPGDDTRLEARPLRPLGPCPVPETPLEAGSYLLVLKRDGFRDVRYPLLVGRGTKHAAKITMYREEEIGADFIQIPAGPFRSGDGRGRPDQAGEFFIGRLEVTVTDYLAFIDNLMAGGAETEAMARLPRRADLGPLLERREGRWFARGFAQVLARWPIMAVSKGDADAYLEWRNRREEGRARYRFPTAAEWEKAARGVDGRIYPWGDRFDPSFTQCDAPDSARPPRPGIAGDIAGDESVYGVRDMAGNVAEFTSDRVSGRAPVVACGGRWTESQSHLFRASSRMSQPADGTNLGVGIRLVKIPPR